MFKRLVVFASAFVLLFAVAGCSSGGASSSEAASSEAVAEAASSEASQGAQEVSTTEWFIEEYNANPNSNVDLVPTEVFDPQDKESPHYRTEFRLMHWKGSKGQACEAGEVSVDIIEPTDGRLRVYATGDSEEGIYEFYRTAAHVIDPEATDEAIEEAIENLTRIDGSDITSTLTKSSAMLEGGFGWKRG